MFFLYHSKLCQLTDLNPFDSLDTIKTTLSNLFDAVDFVICSGGVSMGDKDYIKPVLEQLEFKLHFGRVNMKPGLDITNRLAFRSFDLSRCILFAANP